MSKLRTNIVALSATATLLLGSAAMATPAFAKHRRHSQSQSHNQSINQSANGGSGGKVICQNVGGFFAVGALGAKGPVNACSSVGGNGGLNFGANAQ